MRINVIAQTFPHQSTPYCLVWWKLVHPIEPSVEIRQHSLAENVANASRSNSYLHIHFRTNRFARERSNGQLMSPFTATPNMVTLDAQDSAASLKWLFNDFASVRPLRERLILWSFFTGTPRVLRSVRRRQNHFAPSPTLRCATRKSRNTRTFGAKYRRDG